MRYVRYGFVAIIGLALLVFALANRDPVTVRLLPANLADFLRLGVILRVPLFIVMFAGVVAGLVIGFIWEWLREHKFRAAATHHKRESAKLSREVRDLRGATARGEDDVLALLEDREAAR